MALNFSTSHTDYVQRTAETRRITKTLVGDFTFDYFSDQHRNKVFLPRNMTKVLAFHERNRTRGLDTGTLGSSSSRTRGPILGSSAIASKASKPSAIVEGPINDFSHQDDGHDASGAEQSRSGRPDIEAMSQNCLKVKAQGGSAAEQTPEKRRSARHQLVRHHQDKNAQLYLDLVSIRKKLNFKENAQTNDSRPRKRVRRESIPCHCHVTIWDNRLGLDQKEPIVRKSELCDVSTTEMGAAGFVAEVKLTNPFVFKSSELRVPLETPQGTVLGMGEKYFLEIKIIPTRTDVDWPPIPVLGRSEGDQTAGLGRTAAEKLQNTLCARYMHLPQAPAPDVPLSVFYLHEGSTYRSKYGLEVNATWTKGDMPEAMVKQEEDDTIHLWSIDEQGHSFGRKDSTPTKDTRPTSSSKRVKITQPEPPPVKVTINIDAASAKGLKDFRKTTYTGYQCPVCPKHKFKELEELQFHFTTYHSKYRFVPEKQEYNPITNHLLSVVFKVSAIGVARPRNQEKEPHKNDKDLDWQAPAEPLDVHAFVNGDQNWVERNWVEGPPKKVENAVAAVPAIPDALAVIRSQQYGGFGPAQKGGFLPAEQVLPFREPRRTKYPNIKLRTMTADKETMYTSVSHRPVRVGEEARSESDDEMDDGWFIKKSLEALDIVAEKQDWTDDQRLVRRKWNQARLREKLSHPRYLSDCLIRFVRAEKEWLLEGGLQRKAAFTELIDELLQRRVINQEVVRDVWFILQDDTKQQADTKATTSAHSSLRDGVSTVNKSFSLTQGPKLTPRQERAEILLRLPPYTCVVCTKSIDELRRQGVRCSEHECEAPGAWYHTRCVRCRRKDKPSWKCELCVERIGETKKDKGKQVSID